MRRLPNHFQQRAAALLAVYWLIAILSLMVFTATQFLFAEIAQNAALAESFEAELLAERAIAIASNPEVERWDPLLRKALTDLTSYQGFIESEGGRLNLNTILKDNEDRQMLETLLVLWGFGNDEALYVVDGLVDWVDSDNEINARGAEKTYYEERGWRGRPYNRPFQTLREVEQVRGWELVTARKPNWRAYFTLYSDGKLNLNDAPKDLIQAACLCSNRAADRFLALRTGADNLLYTEDDVRYESVDDALEALGEVGLDRSVVESRVTVAEGVTRYIGIGRVGEVEVERSVIVKSRSSRPQVLSVETRLLR